MGDGRSRWPLSPLMQRIGRLVRDRASTLVLHLREKSTVALLLVHVTALQLIPISLDWGLVTLLIRAGRNDEEGLCCCLLSRSGI